MRCWAIILIAIGVFFIFLIIGMSLFFYQVDEEIENESAIFPGGQENISNETSEIIKCGECQYVVNNTCVDYECCGDSDCKSDEYCLNHTCLKREGCINCTDFEFKISESKSISINNVCHEINVLSIGKYKENNAIYISIDGAESLRIIEEGSIEVEGSKIYAKKINYLIEPEISSAVLSIGNDSLCLNYNQTLAFETVDRGVHGFTGISIINKSVLTGDPYYTAIIVIESDTKWKDFTTNTLGVNYSLFSDFNNHILIAILKMSAGASSPVEIKEINKTEKGYNVYFEAVSGGKGVPDDAWHIIKIRKSDLIEKQNLTFTSFIGYKYYPELGYKEADSISGVDIE